MMSHSNDRPAREREIEPPVGRHGAPMPEKPIEATQARQGATAGRVRYVLLFSLILVILAFILAYAIS